MEDFVDCPDFMDYFRAVWFPRLGMWVAALKSLPYSSQETCSAIELYHDKLKVVLSDEKNTNVYQRTDWLVNKLFTKAHSCFFLESYQCKEHFAPYTKAKWTSGSTSWGRSSEIPDSDVLLEDNRSAKVISQQCQEKTYVVLNPGSEFSLCDCSWSEKGNLCKHMIKVSRMCRRQQSSSPSISLFKYNQALMKLLHFAPHDSLIRDHAVSLTVNVQEALKKHGIVDRVIEREHFEQLATPVESASGIQDEARGSNDVNVTKVVDQTESDSNLCGENAVHMSSCSDDMEVDPVSMCLSPSELPSEGIFSSLRKEDGSRFGVSESLSSNNDSFIIGDRIQDYISDREFRAEMISKGVCMDVLEGSLAGSMMDIDPQPIQPPIQRPLFRCEIH